MKYIFGLTLLWTISIAHSEIVFTHRSSTHNAQSLHSAASNIDERMRTTLRQIRGTIPAAISSIETDRANSNLRNVIVGSMNLLGAAFGVRGSIGDNLGPDFVLRQLTFGDKLNVLAQTMYGVGYVGPFYLELQDAQLDCGLYDFDQAFNEYAFATDFPSIYGYSYSESSDTDPHLLQYYIVEMKNSLKKAIYCITSQKGSNEDAFAVDSFINLYAKLATERLSLTDGILRKSSVVERPIYQG